jgi:hypothetical protein
MINENVFYKKFKDFDWKFYVSIYTDLQKSGINTEQNAINHYWKYGQNEKRRTCEIITKHKLRPININIIFKMTNQYYISSSLEMFQDRFKNKFPNLQTYHNKNEPCLFFGVYNDDDLLKINQHKGLIIIMPGGEDVNPNNLHSLSTINELKKLNNTIFLSISKCIYERLDTLHISNIYIDFNLVDYTLFKPILKNELGNHIFIFNGQIKGRTHIYGKKMYEEIMKKIPRFNYILSNTLNAKYEEMPSIYKKCFIMLRLTENDGNANSVQECKAMNIPVIHNQSEYGLKWKTIDDIINHILHHKI